MTSPLPVDTDRKLVVYSVQGYRPQCRGDWRQVLGYIPIQVQNSDNKKHRWPRADDGCHRHKDGKITFPLTVPSRVFPVW